jgi:hypothetical protein
MEQSARFKINNHDVKEALTILAYALIGQALVTGAQLLGQFDLGSVGALVGVGVAGAVAFGKRLLDGPGSALLDNGGVMTQTPLTQTAGSPALVTETVTTVTDQTAGSEMSSSVVEQPSEVTQ